MKAMRPLIALAVVAAAATFGCPRENPEYVELYDRILDTVGERLSSLELLPADWTEIRDTCRKSAVTAGDDDAFYAAVNCALFQLELSHLGVVPSRDAWAEIEPEVFSPGTVGLSVRKIGRDAVITGVAAGSPAEGAGLRPGWILAGINGSSIDRIEARLRCCPTPPFQPGAGIAHEIAVRLHGEPGSSVDLEVVDDRNASRMVTLIRAARPSRVAYIPDLPVCSEDFETFVLDDVPVIRFNTFMPGNAERFVAFLAEADPATGLVIDLRNNPGGHRLVAENLAGLFVTEPVEIATVESGEDVRKIIIEPGRSAFTGPLAIIVDATSRSASELFAAGLQAVGRATVVGSRTSGSVGPAEMIPLPSGATLVCPSGVTRTPSGSLIEGVGVVPDVHVTPERRTYLDGRDPFIDAAIAAVREQGSVR